MGSETHDVYKSSLVLRPINVDALRLTRAKPELISTVDLRAWDLLTGRGCSVFLISEGLRALKSRLPPEKDTTLEMWSGARLAGLGAAVRSGGGLAGREASGNRSSSSLSSLEEDDCESKGVTSATGV